MQRVHTDITRIALAPVCGVGIVEKDYVRDSQTRLIYCDAQCLAGQSHMTIPFLNGRGRKLS
jgi:hypothetical protein